MNDAEQTPLDRVPLSTLFGPKSLTPPTLPGGEAQTGPLPTSVGLPGLDIPTPPKLEVPTISGLSPFAGSAEGLTLPEPLPNEHPPAPEPKWVKEALLNLLQPTRRKGTALAATGGVMLGAVLLNTFFSGTGRGPAVSTAKADSVLVQTEQSEAPKTPDVVPLISPEVAPTQRQPSVSVSTSDPIPTPQLPGLSDPAPSVENPSPAIPEIGSLSVPTVPGVQPSANPGVSAPEISLPTMSTPGINTASLAIPGPELPNPNTGGVSTPAPSLSIPSANPIIPAANFQPADPGGGPAIPMIPSGNPAAPPAPSGGPMIPTLPAPAVPLPGSGSPEPMIPAPALPGGPAPAPVVPSLPPASAPVSAPALPELPAEKPRVDPVAVPTIPAPSAPLPTPAMPVGEQPKPSLPQPMSNPAPMPFPVAPVVDAAQSKLPPAGEQPKNPAFETPPPAFREEKPAENPPIGTLPATQPAANLRLSPTPEPGGAASPSTAEPPRTLFDVDLYQPKPTDSFATISRQSYGDERFAVALQEFNGRLPLGQTAEIRIPPMVILKKRYPQLVNAPRPASYETPRDQGTGANWERPKTVAAQSYIVSKEGLTLHDIADELYGDWRKWKNLSDANPQVDPNRLPKGLKLDLPAGLELKKSTRPNE